MVRRELAMWRVAPRICCLACARVPARLLSAEPKRIGGRSHCTYLRLGPQHKRSTLADMVRACIRLTIPNCGNGGGRAIIIRHQALHAQRLPLTAMQLGASTRPDTTPQHAAEAHVLVMNVAVVSMFSVCLGSVHAVFKSSSRPAQCHYPAMLLCQLIDFIALALKIPPLSPSRTCFHARDHCSPVRVFQPGHLLRACSVHVRPQQL